MARFLLICCGGALGTGARYLVSTWAAGALSPSFPFGTFLVNVTGSFLIAFVMELSSITGAISEELRLFLTTGIMGGYTTYSSFNFETLRLAASGAVAGALANVGITVLACIASGVLGLAAARGVVRLGLLLATGGH